MKQHLYKLSLILNHLHAPYTCSVKEKQRTKVSLLGSWLQIVQAYDTGCLTCLCLFSSTKINLISYISPNQFMVVSGMFYCSISGENKHYDTPTNPAAPAKVPGGSSSGAAVAVAASLVDFSLGELFLLPYPFIFSMDIILEFHCPVLYIHKFSVYCLLNKN